MMERNWDVEAGLAESLLDIGVSIPVGTIRLPWRKPVQLRLTMRRPPLGAVLRIARIYLRMGVTSERMHRFTKEEQMAFIASHGFEACRMVALMICRGRWSGLLLAPLLARYLLWRLDSTCLMAICARYITLLDTGDFEIIIRFTEKILPTPPMGLSQTRKRS